MKRVTVVKVLSYVAVATLMVGLGVLVALAQQRQDLRKRADTSATATSGVLDCDPGTDPYNSNTIVVTNNTSEPIDHISFDVFRCEYVPGKVEQYRGSFKCEPACAPGEPNCSVGQWDGDLDQRNVVLQPGESKTFTASANACETIQIDVRNDSDAGESKECHNVRSSSTVAFGDRWPGGIAFGISENATGYPNCVPSPTPSVPASNTPTPSVSVTNTLIPQPTAPPGQPTYTPIPTTPPSVIVPTATPVPVSKGGVPNTPTPALPVSGSGLVTGLGIIGAVGLILLTLL
ncbi:hypothetical protein HY469_01880 [Candidatus Roizmanbacteria bacterium]|nr:hypothetical protein [Candidatus Roizmanbacteria bacterium]